MENIFGRREVYIYSNGVKVHYEKGNYTLIYAAPNWRINYFNRDRKTIYSSTLDQWSKQSGFRYNLMTQNFLPPHPIAIKGVSRQIKGHKIQSYIVKSADSGHFAKPTGANSAVETFWDVCDEIVMSPELSRLTEQTMGQPIEGRNFPFQIRVILEDGSEKSRLFTYIMEKEIVPANFFEPPSGYRAVKSESEITLGSGLIDDLINDLGSDLSKH